MVLDIGCGRFTGFCITVGIVFESVSANTEKYAYVDTIEQNGGSSLGYKWQWLSRYGEESNGHHHVQHGLADKQQCNANYEESGEIFVTSLGYSSSPEHKNDI